MLGLGLELLLSFGLFNSARHTVIWQAVKIFPTNDIFLNKRHEGHQKSSVSSSGPYLKYTVEVLLRILRSVAASDFSVPWPNEIEIDASARLLVENRPT